MIRRLACDRYKIANGVVKKEGRDLVAYLRASRLSGGHKGRGHVRVMTGWIKQEKALSLRSCVDLIITK
jgi:hypothetical protein